MTTDTDTAAALAELRRVCLGDRGPDVLPPPPPWVYTEAGLPVPTVEHEGVPSVRWAMLDLLALAVPVGLALLCLARAMWVMTR